MIFLVIVTIDAYESSEQHIIGWSTDRAIAQKHADHLTVSAKTLEVRYGCWMLANREPDNQLWEWNAWYTRRDEALKAAAKELGLPTPNRCGDRLFVPTVSIETTEQLAPEPKKG